MTGAVGMNGEKALTVSVAAYNVEAYLAETLESCVVPNMDLLEVIVVDDGSTDGTAGIAQKFVDRYPGTFRLISKENGGYGSTVNASLAAARGRYFKLLDGDDWYETDALQKYLETLIIAQEDVIYTPYIRRSELGMPDEIIDGLDDRPDGRMELFDADFENPLAMHSLAYRTELLRRIGFSHPEHYLYTDIVFAYVPISQAKTMLVSHAPLYIYRIGRDGQSVSRGSIAKHYEDIIRVCARPLLAAE